MLDDKKIPSPPPGFVLDKSTEIPPPPAGFVLDKSPGYGNRIDGTPKGNGYFGPLKRPDGDISTELSIGVDFDGKETQIPAIVPTLTQQEVDHLLSGKKLTPAMAKKAITFAKTRMAAGKSPFAQPDEPPMDIEKHATIGPSPKPVKEPFNLKEFVGELPINIARGVAGMVKSIPDIGPGVAKMALGVEQDLQDKGINPMAMTGLDVIKSASETVGEPMVRGYVGGWKEMLSDPAKYAKENPADFANNILDALTAGTLTVVHGAGLISKINRARKVLSEEKALTVAKSKSIVQPILDDVNKLGKEREGERWYDLKYEEPGTVYNQAGAVLGQEIPPAIKPPKAEVKWGDGKLVDKPLEIKRIDSDIDTVMKEQASGLPESPIEYPVVKQEAPIAVEQGIAKAAEVSKIDSPTLDIGKLAPIPPKPELKYYTIGGDVGEMIEKMVVPSTKSGLKAFGQAIHSPNRVMGTHPMGTQIWENFDRAELNKLSWLSNRVAESEPMTRFIKAGSPISTAVQKIRDGVKNVEDVLKMDFDEAAKLGLTKEEYDSVGRYKEYAVAWDKHLDAAFDSNLRTWGNSVVGKREQELWAKANESRRYNKPPTKEFLGKLDENETKVFNLYRNRIEKYITHVFPKKDLLGYLEMEFNNMSSKLAKVRKPASRERLQKYLGEIKKSIADINAAKSPFEGMPPEIRSAYEAYAGGQPVFYDVLPKKISDRFFKRRTGGAGYVQDSVTSYHTYLGWMGRKIFDEPAVRFTAAHFNELPPELKDYTKWFVRDYMGYNRDPLSKPLATIKSLMWMKTLGFNPRSAVVNLTQRMNLVADSNPMDFAEGYRLCFTDKGNELFNNTGLLKTIPTVLMEGDVPNNSIEALRNAAGWMFSKVEEGNLKVSFLTGYTEGIRKGKTAEEAIQMGVRKAEKTQFRYGKLGTPKMMRGAGGVAFQFWSYPIKQVEFLTDLAKNNPKKLIAWVALSEGSNQALQDFLDTDLSSALGLGTNWGELIEAFKDVKDGDYRKMIYDLRQTFKTGGGLLPAGPGPAISLASTILKAFPVLAGEEPPSKLIKEAVPVVVQRGMQAYGALKEGPNESGLYSIRDIGTGKERYQENLRQVIQRTVGPKPMAETRQANERRKQSLDAALRNAISKNIAELLADGKVDEAREMAAKYGNTVWPTKQSIKAARDSRLGRNKKVNPKLKRFQEEYLNK